jgi:hypothetical protein
VPLEVLHPASVVAKVMLTPFRFFTAASIVVEQLLASDAVISYVPAPTPSNTGSLCTSP